MGPVLMGLNRAGLESNPPPPQPPGTWLPGHRWAKGGQNREACPQAGAHSFSA